ncbi:MAG: hypothetical protein NUW22_06055 [Acidobacteria bacterium]|nr:hypothetical protein [Acidobacteriota bacterium]
MQKFHGGEYTVGLEMSFLSVSSMKEQGRQDTMLGAMLLVALWYARLGVWGQVAPLSILVVRVGVVGSPPPVLRVNGPGSPWRKSACSRRALLNDPSKEGGWTAAVAVGVSLRRR